LNIAELLKNEELLKKLAISAAWIITVLVIRAVLLRFVRKQEWYTDEIRMRWQLRLGQSTLLLLVLGVLAVWGSEMQAMALSAVAIAAAIVIALKEIILCVSGSFYRAAADSFGVGDRIELGTVKGDVISYGILSTTVLEIGPNHLRTGRAVVVPNSLFLSNALVNETITDDFVLHSFFVPLTRADDWQRAEAILLEAANEICGEYTAQARQHMEVITVKFGLPPAAVDPRVSIMIPEADKIDLVVRIPTPSRKKGAVEQAILRRYLERSAAPGDSGESGGTPGVS